MGGGAAAYAVRACGYLIEIYVKSDLEQGCIVYRLVCAACRAAVCWKIIEVTLGNQILLDTITYLLFHQVKCFE